MKSSKYQLVIDRELCIGAASCIAVAPKAFDLDNEAKVIILPTLADETDETLLDAARSCPVSAIRITDHRGNAVFP